MRMMFTSSSAPSTKEKSKTAVTIVKSRQVSISRNFMSLSNLKSAKNGCKSCGH